MDISNGSTQIIVQFTSDFPHLFDNMQRYLPLINHLLAGETQNKFFMESIQGGLIFIYNDLETFLLMNQPYKPEDILAFRNSHGLEINPLLLTERIINHENFPKNGVNFQYGILAQNKSQICEVIERHFKSFLFENVRRVNGLSFDLVLNLSKFECIVLYTNLASSMYSGILTENKT